MADYISAGDKVQIVGKEGPIMIVENVFSEGMEKAQQAKCIWYDERQREFKSVNIYLPALLKILD